MRACSCFLVYASAVDITLRYTQIIQMHTARRLTRREREYFRLCVRFAILAVNFRDPHWLGLGLAVMLLPFVV